MHLRTFLIVLGRKIFREDRHGGVFDVLQGECHCVPVGRAEWDPVF